MDAKLFIARYEQILKDRHIKKSELYKYCGFSSGAVSQWKSGATSPALRTMEKIADYLQVPLNELMAEKETSPSPEGNELDSELVKLLTHLRPEEAAQVRAYVQGMIAGREV